MSAQEIHGLVSGFLPDEAVQALEAGLVAAPEGVDGSFADAMLAARSGPPSGEHAKVLADAFEKFDIDASLHSTRDPYVLQGYQRCFTRFGFRSTVHNSPNITCVTTTA